MSSNIVEVEENTETNRPLVNISVPEGQQVTLGPSSTPFAFRIQGTQLFLNVTPDYEVRTQAWGAGVWGLEGADPPWDPRGEGPRAPGSD